jgi:alcohol dehydrogenase YqhD (iron-dependent ADH family)
VTEAERPKAADKGLDLIEAFFQRMCMPVRTAEMEPSVVSGQAIVDYLARAGQTGIGKAGDKGEAMVLHVMELAA